MVSPRLMEDNVTLNIQKVRIENTDYYIDLSKPDAIIIAANYGGQFNRSAKVVLLKNALEVKEHRSNQCPATSHIAWSSRGVEFEREVSVIDDTWVPSELAILGNKAVTYPQVGDIRKQESVTFSAIDWALKAVEAMSPAQKATMSHTQIAILGDMQEKLKESELMGQQR